jgi:alpha-L-rhamnosidase
MFVTPASAHEPQGPAPYFRREFTVGSPLRKATLHVTAIGLVEAYLNGARVGDEVLAPGWTSYRHRLQVSSFDVTELIEDGSNVVGAVVGEGWAVGRLGYEGRGNHYAQRPALFLQLDLDYGGHTEMIGTGPEFTTATGAVLSNSLYDGETDDARQEPEGWSTAGFDAGDWRPVVEFDWDTDTLIPRTAPPIRRIEELAPIAVTSCPNGTTLVDFGQILTGWVRMTVDGPAGATVTLRHAELLRDGELDPATLRTAKSVDRYILRGGGPETWEPRFTFHGFRYVEIDGYPGKPAPEAVRAVVVHSDMARTGWLETSDARLNQLYSNVVWSMRGNFVGVPTDCPQRDERLGWTGDINAFGPVAAFLYDVRGVLDSWLADLAAEHREKGFVPFVVPDVLATPSPPTALWSDVAVSLPWALYAEYGDVEILRRNYESMTAFVRDVAARLDENGLWSSGFQFGDWLDPDAPPDQPSEAKTDRYLVAQAYLCKVTRELARIADVLGHESDEAEFSALADSVRVAFQRMFVTPAGRVAGETATAYSLAIQFELLDANQLTTAGDRLAEVVSRSGYRISTGFAGTPHVLDALSSTGHLAEAYEMLLATGCPSFLYPVTMGATTVWERWDAIRPDGSLNDTGMTSLNHYAYGAVADWMHRVVGGLSSTEPGYRAVRIAPQPGGGLTHASLAHRTIHGMIEVSWRVDEGEVALDVVLPSDVVATVVLPHHPDELRMEVAGGVHHWRYESVCVSLEYTLDTPLRTLVDDPRAWQALKNVLAHHFPGVPLDRHAPESVVSLNALLAYLPAVPQGLEDDLLRALDIANA